MVSAASSRWTARAILKPDAPVDYLMVLRGAAALGVALGHLFGLGSLSLGAVVSKGQYNFVFHAEPFETWRTVLEILTPLIGLNFVILFFVQSGYLMGKVFFDGRYDAARGRWRFYRARFLRLAPALYVNLFFCALFFRYADTDPTKLLGDVFFVNNVTGVGINPVTWSLSHEMQYYLVAPFVFLAFRSRSTTTNIAFLALLVVVYALCQWVPGLPYVYCFLVGFGVNLVPKPTLTPLTKKIGLVVGLLVVHLGFNVLHFHHRVAEAVLVATLASAVLVYVCEAKAPAERGGRWLRFGMWTGYLTYGFYLWHYVVIRTLAEYLEPWARAIAGIDWLRTAMFHALEVAIALPLSYAIAWLSFVLIESRFRPQLYAIDSGSFRKALPAA